MRVAAALLFGILPAAVCGQNALQTPGAPKQVPKVVPVPRLPERPWTESPPEESRVANEPTSPAAQTVTDSRTRVSLRLPAGWIVSRTDGEVSTFHLDARTAPARAQLRLVAMLGFNPFPKSTFSGAMLYLSTVPHSTAATCAAETGMRPAKRIEPATIADVKFARGKDEHGQICTEARDVTYTAMHSGSCLRFDLAVNSFCGGDVSGAEDLTDAQLGSIFARLSGILDTLTFTPR